MHWTHFRLVAVYIHCKADATQPDVLSWHLWTPARPDEVGMQRLWGKGDGQYRPRRHGSTAAARRPRAGVRWPADSSMCALTPLMPKELVPAGRSKR